MLPKTIVSELSGRASEDALRVCAALGDFPERHDRLDPETVTRLLYESRDRLNGAIETWEAMEPSKAFV